MVRKRSAANLLGMLSMQLSQIVKNKKKKRLELLVLDTVDNHVIKILKLVLLMRKLKMDTSTMRTVKRATTHGKNASKHVPCSVQ